jgi:hypothetical protein
MYVIVSAIRHLLAMLPAGYEALAVGHIWILNHVSIVDGIEAVTVAVASGDRFSY